MFFCKKMFLCKNMLFLKKKIPTMMFKKLTISCRFTPKYHVYESRFNYLLKRDVSDTNMLSELKIFYLSRFILRSYTSLT